MSTIPPLHESSPFEWRPFCVALVSTAAVVALVWLVRPPVYLTNDDVAIRQGIEGRAFPGQPPSGFVLMTHAALASSIARMQRVIPSAPLWDIVLAGTLVWALATLVSVAWTSVESGWLARGTAIGALLAAVVPLITGVQFTISATLAGGAAMTLAVQELANARRRTTVLVLSGLLLLSGLLVRPMGAAAGAIGTAVLLAPLAVGQRTRRIHLAHLVSLAGAAVALLAVLLYVDGVLYGLSPEWAAYHQYNWMIARLFEWGGELRPADTDAVRASVGWSQNDWMMLQRWWGVDPDIHGLRRVADAYESRAALAGWTGSARGILARVAAFDAVTMRRLFIESAPVLAAGVTLVAVYANRRGALAAAAVVALFYAFCLAVEAAFKELPFRLFAPLQACFMAALLMTSGGLRRTRPPWLAVLGLSVILTIVVQQARAVAGQLHDRDRRAADVQLEAKAIQRLAPSLVVIHADAFPLEYWWRPFRPSPSGFPAIQLALNNQNPLLQKFLSDTRRQPLLRAICQDRSLIVLSQPSRLEYVTRYLGEHFRTDVEWSEVYAGSFRAWRCAPSAPARGQPES